MFVKDQAICYENAAFSSFPIGLEDYCKKKYHEKEETPRILGALFGVFPDRVVELSLERLSDFELIFLDRGKEKVDG